MQGTTRIPIATYRLQLNSQFTFEQATALVSYLNLLGISHCYTSPLLVAKTGSQHGYDIVDHSKFNPEIGTEEEFGQFIKTLRSHEMGVILDIVPNHMYILDSANQWWCDVLENGPSSPYANYFDIDWHSPRPILDNKVLLPLLNQQYGDALENQMLKVSYQQGAFVVELPDLTLPTDPKSWNLILETLVSEAQKSIAEDDPAMLELQSIVTSLTHLPLTSEKSSEKIIERQREKEVVKRRLKTLIEHHKEIADLLENYLAILKGKKGDSRSFNALEAFLNAQPYRLCFWRVANDEINYRRFFDIFEFAGIRTERTEVFKATHDLICNLVQKKLIDGVRIDHVDGLWDPEQYFQEFQRNCVPQTEQNEILLDNHRIFAIAEKILIGNEKLRPEWLINGTVGYDFLNQLNGVFVHRANKASIYDVYYRFTGVNIGTLELMNYSKKLILNVSMSSELQILARRLDRIAGQHRSSRDFTTGSLRVALRDIIACFPVYRSYIRAQEGLIHDEDRQYIISAVSWAKRLNPAISASIYDFIKSVLFLEHPSGLDESQKEERCEFVMRFQQLTGPVMAKGLEDTAFYRFYPLTSLKEVGSDPYSFGVSIDTFHKKNQERLESWPHSLAASSTHDTKRSEDVRARINVLSEIPEEWEEALKRWSEINLVHKSKDDDASIPDANEEYLFYQTLVGVWPLHPMDPAGHLQFVKRLQTYIEKALKEAKIHTSWINPNKDYDKAVSQFIEKVLDHELPKNTFVMDFQAFVAKIAQYGMLNSLSQVLLKLTSPGVPDIYQGNEIWDFSLVDPDNRRPVDFTLRKYLFQSFSSEAEDPATLLQKLIRVPQDGRIKMFITHKALKLRQKLPELFARGEYLPLTVHGERQNNVIAFARRLNDKTVITIATRFLSGIMKDFEHPIKSNPWKDTYISLPESLSKCCFNNVLTSSEINVNSKKGETALYLDEILQPIPLALLESVEGGSNAHPST